MKESVYIQRATDSLLNFETVKYFNAEDHEEGRFASALDVYKDAALTVQKSLISLNLAQSFVVILSLEATHILGYYYIR